MFCFLSNVYFVPMKSICVLLTIFCLSACQSSEAEKRDDMTPPVPAPFEDLDTIATNDWWNRGPNPIIDVDVDRNDVICFGMYTVSDGVMKMTAQLFPLYPQETRTVRLETKRENDWQEIQTQEINDIGWSALFRVEDWDTGSDIKYRLRHGDAATFEGVVRSDPERSEIKLGAFSCNSNKDRGMRDQYVQNVSHLDPDLLFFAGDQSYDHKEHTAAWLKFGIQFRDLFRDRPCITIPDDHDIGQGNIWGEYGKKASSSAGNDGGYFYDVDYVKMVERCQTAHLPDPYDATPVERGIGVYYTNLSVGAVDLAKIED